MNGPSHYLEAEACLRAAARTEDQRAQTYALMRAQVHATLAQAAAAAPTNGPDGDRWREAFNG